MYKRFIAALIAFTLIAGTLPASSANIKGMNTITANAETTYAEWDLHSMYAAMESWNVTSVKVLDHKPANSAVKASKCISADGKVYIGNAADAAATMYIWSADGGKVKAANHCKCLFNGIESDYLCYEIHSIDCSGLDTSGETSMNSMFILCSNLTSLNISSLDTSSVTDMGGMFDGCESLVTLDLHNFNTGSVKNMCAMFQCCRKLKNLDVRSFNTSAATDMSFMFNTCDGLVSLDLSGFELSRASNLANMIYRCDNITSVDLSSAAIKSNATVRNFAANCPKLTSIRCTKEAYTALGVPSTINRLDASVLYTVGDIDESGSIDGSDATLALKEYAATGAGKPSSLNSKRAKAGDVDGSGGVDGSDATLILKYYALAGAGKNPRWDSIFSAK